MFYEETCLNWCYIIFWKLLSNTFTSQLIIEQSRDKDSLNELKRAWRNKRRFKGIEDSRVEWTWFCKNEEIQILEQEDEKEKSRKNLTEKQKQKNFCCFESVFDSGETKPLKMYGGSGGGGWPIPGAHSSSTGHLNG